MNKLLRHKHSFFAIGIWRCKNCILVLLLPLFTSCVHAQDTLDLYRQFIKICTRYQQVPLQGAITIRNQDTYITSEEDTTTYLVNFCLQPHSTYIKLSNEWEQVADDSVMLIINNRLKRMIVTKAQPVDVLMKNFTRFSMQDSSLLQLSKQYSVSTLPPQNGLEGIELNSRYLTNGTALPAKTIRVYYSRIKTTPEEIREIQRHLIPVSSTGNDSLSAVQKFPNRIINIQDRGNFLINEKATSFVYNIITHETDKAIPATVADRVVKNDGTYIPAKGYESYQLSIDR